MNILKPQKMLFDNLYEVNDLVEEIKNKQELEKVIFTNTGLRNSYFQENKLKNVIFKQADLTQTQFF